MCEIVVFHVERKTYPEKPYLLVLLRPEVSEGVDDDTEDEIEDDDDEDDVEGEVVEDAVVKEGLLRGERRDQRSNIARGRTVQRPAVVEE